MVTIAIAVMIVVVVAIVAWPYFNPTREQVSSPDAADPTVENLTGLRDATYLAIKDLEFDHTLGKLSDADYRTMRAKYETKAVAVLQQLDGLAAARGHPPRAAESDEQIEREVRGLRRHSVEVGSTKCPKCGAAHAPGDAFCAKCGASLRGARCPTCGTRAALGDQFCARCGARIKG
ncbi:MAG: zinc-ribbon domain-containing protein [Chloroflexi bacterium]|nr:zinc-ribbon domain-containing protein [Chloroflexota bacterium]